ncbi:UNVERIFIED_CONTAM: hypothetical protein Sradi_0462800 [Sesamum radiatum]|uniref:Uncharacterized protein n=1 Tax=Sesamum radiatum TaxID=300843 RepID=A0AAW2W8B9_SESRA
MSEMTGTTQEEVSEGRPWLLQVDSSSTTQGSGAGIMLTTLKGTTWNLSFSSNSRPQTTKPNMKPWS